MTTLTGVKSLPAEEIESTLNLIFAPGGLLSRMLPGYEERPQQLEMALLVWECLAKGEHGLVEAGTGVGKSLAYLFPAALWALARGERVVLSTHTIALQQQLLHKDLPTVAQALAQLGAPELRSVLVKGRNHYLCRRRLEAEFRLREERADFWLVSDEGDEALRRLWAWAREPGATGDRAEVPFPLPAQVWVKVQSDSEECAGDKCPHREQCFFRRSRRKQETAHLLVTNHALLLSDLEKRRETGGQGLLAPHEALICDEAHHLDRVAAEHLGTRLTAPRFRSLAEGVEALLGQAKDHLPPSALVPYREALARALDASSRFFASLQARVGAKPLRLRAPVPEGREVLAELERLGEALEQLAQAGLSEEHAELASQQARRCRLLGEELARTTGLQDPEQAYWLEPTGLARSGSVALCSAPLSVGEILGPHLFGQNRSVILTSATLAPGGDFGYVARSLGLEEYRGLALGSPFDYQTQAVLCIPEDARATDPNRSDYLAYVADKVREILDLSRGRAFVLFTSYGALQQVYERTFSYLQEKGYTPLRQGDAPREELLEAFRQNVSSVLFGVDSFWEGVDVAGEALSCVIIARLPFEAPDDPLVEARCERLRSQGKDPFWEYSLPRAAIKLKQGFGRLIRSRSDRGAVVVLDHRLATRRYGRYLLGALPPVRTTTDLAGVAAILAQQ